MNFEYTKKSRSCKIWTLKFVPFPYPVKFTYSCPCKVVLCLINSKSDIRVHWQTQLFWQEKLPFETVHKYSSIEFVKVTLNSQRHFDGLNDMSQYRIDDISLDVFSQQKKTTVWRPIKKYNNAVTSPSSPRSDVTFA